MPKKSIFIQIGENTYPFRMTLGAMLRFKRATGKEVAMLDDENLEEVANLLYACIASACAADKVQFPFDFEEFCDRLSAEDMEAMTDLLTAQPDGETASQDPAAQKKR